MKEGLSAASPLIFVIMRFALAAAVMVPFIGLGQRFTRAELGAGALLTLLLSSGFATQAVGLVYTTPARSAFIVALSSVIAPVVALVALRQRQRLSVFLALAVATAGLYFLTAPDTGGLNRGDLWTLVTAIVFGAQIVAVAEVAGRFAAARLVWLQLAGTAVLLAPVAFLLERARVTWSFPLVGALLYTAVFATALAFVWQMHAQRRMSSARAALIFCFEPIFAALASWLWFGETLTSSQWLGGALILAGMLVADLPARAESGMARGLPDDRSVH